MSAKTRGMVVGVAIAVLALIGVPAASASFGIETFEGGITAGNGTADTQAGSHPYQYSFTLTVPTHESLFGLFLPTANMKDLNIDLPVGLVGNPQAAPACLIERLATGAASCPPDSQVGVVYWEGAILRSYSALYRIQAPPGVPAEFAFNELGTLVTASATTTARSGYGVEVRVRGIAEAAAMKRLTVTLWGVPASHGHDEYRGACIVSGEPSGEKCESEAPPAPFLTLPTKCQGPLRTSAAVDSWEEPGVWHEASFLNSEKGTPVGLEGCEPLTFNPGLTARPGVRRADSPTGISVGLHIPQNESPEGFATAHLKDASVTLPAGLAIDPSGANGLAACSEGQFGLGNDNPAGCPDASKVGSVEVDTPLLAHPLSGGVYVAEQDHNPFGSTFALYVAVEGEGVVVKLAGEVEPNPTTGQLTATFSNNPQLPFSDLKMHFFEGSDAVLATPSACGIYTTTSLLTPWSGSSPVSPTDSFEINEAADGGACAAAGFAPQFSAGLISPQAGGFSPFTMSLSRQGGEQQLSGLTLHMPAGLEGILAKVSLCGQAQANAGTCSAASLIGTTAVAAGAGPAPLWVKGGEVYLTGPYKGAPFGLSIVVPAVAGPFNLGSVVVRASIAVDPRTAVLTITSDPLPTILKGVPLDVRVINVTIDREGFTFNPTSCRPRNVSGTIASTAGANANVSSHFQAVNCAGLAFKPGFKASTSAKTSRANGASLTVKLTYPKAPFGSQANIKSVHVELPKALPSRLSTLNHACPDSVFNQNPATCPAQSKVGFAKAVTPALPVALEGPAYFVSHGGQKFPELVMVLQGYGVTLDLSGETFISKAGITSSTFKSVPDVPVSSFELTLPQGTNSALAANRDLCTAPLPMPTVITAQNGAVLRQSTKVAVSGCKPAIRVVGHRIEGSHASIRVSVPSAGTLTASGAGIERSLARAARAQVVTIEVALGRHDRQVLAKNPRQRIDARVKLTFRRRHGPPLSAHVRLLMG